MDRFGRALAAALLVAAFAAAVVLPLLLTR